MPIFPDKGLLLWRSEKGEWIGTCVSDGEREGLSRHH